MSASKAICDHIRGWWFGTKTGTYVSMGIMSDGSYGIQEGIVYSFPVTIGADRNYSIVQGLQVDDFSRDKMNITAKELLNEKQDALSFLEQQPE